MAGRGILSRALPPLIRERCLHGAGRSRRIAFGSIRIMGYLWVKAFHIVFVASWFAGLFYLPRIYVNLAMVPPGSDAERARLLLMAHKLMRFTHMLMVPAVGLGLVLWLGYGIGLTGPHNGWMHAKLTLVLVILAYHASCARLLQRWDAGRNTRSHVWYRWYNELPVLVLTAVCILVVVKPF